MGIVVMDGRQNFTNERCLNSHLCRAFQFCVWGFWPIRIHQDPSYHDAQQFVLC